MATEEPTGDLIVDSIEECFDRGWSDELPVVPPTPAGLTRMVRASGREPDEVIGILPPKGGLVTVEKVALNALMAGCKPAYMPVVLAAAEVLTDPRFNIRAVASSTRGTAPLMVVNGPIRHELEINCRGNLFGPGWRANSTIGRSIRLLMRNVGGALPGELDRATLGHPGKYSYCIGEDEEHSPWEPLHVERGFKREDSVVTVMGSEAPKQFGLPQGSADQVLDVLVDGLRFLTHFSSSGGAEVVLIISDQHRDVLSAAGYSKKTMRRYIMEKAWRSAAEIRASGSQFLGSAQTVAGETRVYAFKNEDSIHIIAAGDITNRFSAFLPTLRSTPGVAEPVSRLVRPR
jgi:hypothetical protein